jgi:hypothetical protein
VTDPVAMAVDGFGRRTTGTDAETGDEVELLDLAPQLVEHSGFVTTLGERVARFASVRHASYVHMRRLDRPAADRLELVSDLTPGWRLSELLDASHAAGIPVDIAVVIAILRQLMPAVALYSRHDRENAIGALAVERLIVTPQARLVIAEHAFGPALEKLNFGRERLWRELRVAMPASAGLPRANQRADAHGIGIVALSLLLGRRLATEDFPAQLQTLFETAQEHRDGSARPLSASFATWLGRALHLDVKTAFQSASEAQLAFESVLASDRSYVTSPVKLEEWVSSVGGPMEKKRAPAAVADPEVLRQQELARQRDAEREREREQEMQRLREAERLGAEEMERLREQERQRAQEVERLREQEREREQQLEQEREQARQREEARLRELEREREQARQREEDRKRELEREREIARQREQERQAELQRELEAARQREHEREQLLERERQQARQREEERQRELERERATARQREQELEHERGQQQRDPGRERELERELQVAREREQERERELERERVSARQREDEAERELIRERDRARAAEQAAAAAAAAAAEAEAEAAATAAEADARVSEAAARVQEAAARAQEAAARVQEVSAAASYATSGTEHQALPVKPARGPMMYALAGVVVLLLAAVGWLATRPTGDGMREGEGELAVSSSPVGATVIVDGKEVGVTPASVRLPAGAHVLEVRVGNAEPRVIPLTITAGVVDRQYIELRDVAKTGTLSIRSEPSGARILIDGQPRGTTPATIANLPVGDRTVVLELRGRKATQTVKIAPGGTAQLVVPLPR